MSLEPGFLIADKFLVVRLLGAGGLGEVYEVEHRFTRHRRALKLLHQERRGNAEVVERFLLEASAAGQIGDPHIVETFDVGSLPDGSPYLVMEYLQGGPLSDVLRLARRFEVGLACQLMGQVCDAMEAAHRAGIVHRDLKPENLFAVERQGLAFIKILDFGVSKFSVERNGSMRVTGTNVALGSPLYMAPEQMRRAKDVDARADLYSVGVILHELLSGEVPYSAPSFAELAGMVLHGGAPSLASRALEVPAELSDAVGRCLAVNPGHRFASAAELGEVLARFAGPPPRWTDLPVGFGQIGEELHDTSTRHPAPARASDPSTPLRSGVASPAATVRGSTPPTGTLGLDKLAPLPGGRSPARRPLAVGLGAAAVVLGGGLWATLRPAPAAAPEARTAPPSVAAPAPDPRQAARALLASRGMVVFPRGTYPVGASGGPAFDGPPHAVELEAFALSRHEVTVGELRAFAATGAPVVRSLALPPAGLPAVDVKPAGGLTWEAAAALCAWAYPRGRLPREEEWEAAARGASGRAWPWGAEPHPACVNAGRGEEAALLTEEELACGRTPEGVAHLLGNVAEWTLSAPARYPGSAAAVSPAVLGPGFHVVRGGSARDDAAKATVARRTILRDAPLPDDDEPDPRRAVVGARCAADVD
jgi:serine/threonine-protein kinase